MDAPASAAVESSDGPRVIDILRRHVADYVKRCSPPLRVRGVLAQLSLCRTTALGGQGYECKDCGAKHASCHSCGQRHCPLCRGASRADWQQRMADNLLPTAYFQGVFTIPTHLSSLTLGNRAPMYNLLFRAAGAAFCELLAEERGIEAAPQLVLHTWDQRLEPHAHVHLLHPAGGPSLCGTRWISCRRIQNGKCRGKLFLVDVRKLSDRFHDKFLKGLNRLRQRGELKLEGKWSRLLDDNQWQRFLEPLRTQKWAVYLEPPPSTNASPENLLKYLARYVTGGPISDRRLISHENGEVEFWARDKSKTGNRVPVCLSGVEFVRRWSLHIVPSGFHRVRYYGGMHPSKRTAYLSRCRVLLHQSAGEDDTNHSATSSESGEAPPPEVASRRHQLRQGICPDCGGGLRVTWSLMNRPSWHEVLNSPLAPNWYRANGP